jgi:hypothetical protein
MTEIVPTTKRLYELQYCPDKDEYDDHPPVKKSERSLVQWFCPCKCNAVFVTHSDFMRHINLKIHKDYKANYKFLNSHLLESKSEIKDLKRENHRLDAKYIGQNKKYKRIKKGLKEHIKYKKELENDIQKLKEENQVLNEKQNIVDEESIISSDSDDDFEDCY